MAIFKRRVLETTHVLNKVPGASSRPDAAEEVPFHGDLGHGYGGRQEPRARPGKAEKLMLRWVDRVAGRRP